MLKYFPLLHFCLYFRLYNYSQWYGLDFISFAYFVVLSIFSFNISLLIHSLDMNGTYNNFILSKFKETIWKTEWQIFFRCFFCHRDDYIFHLYTVDTLDYIDFVLIIEPAIQPWTKRTWSQYIACVSFIDDDLFW